MTSRIYPSSVGYHSFVAYRKDSSFSLPIIFLTLFFCFLPLSKAHGEIVEIPLPELVGIYTMNDTSARTVSFDLGHPVFEVHQAWIQWSGSITPGVIARPSQPTVPWPCEVYAYLDTIGTSYWSAFFGPVEGSFRDTTTFKAIFNPTWDFLSDGIGDLTVKLLPEILLCYHKIYESPIVQLDTVSIIFDVDLATGVGNSSPDGEIKIQYRKNPSAP